MIGLLGICGSVYAIAATPGRNDTVATFDGWTVTRLISNPGTKDEANIAINYSRLADGGDTVTLRCNVSEEVPGQVRRYNYLVAIDGPDFLSSKAIKDRPWPKSVLGISGGHEQISVQMVQRSDVRWMSLPRDMDYQKFNAVFGSFSQNRALVLTLQPDDGPPRLIRIAGSEKLLPFREWCERLVS
jgi:hypothetical protein